MQLAAKAQEAFTITTPDGLFTPTRAPQGVLNATAYFQGVMTELLAGLNCKVWVEDIVWWVADKNNLLNTLDKIFDRLEDTGLFVAAHKCPFFDTKISWCRNMYSEEKVPHDLERLSGLASMHHP